MAPARILIVDDQRDITRLLRIALEALGRGYAVVDVPSAEEALLEVRRGPVDVLVTDLRLPGITGLELIKRLRNMASKAEMIVVSAYADEMTQGECRRLGAAFFPKPLNLDAFLARVQRSLQERAVPAVAPEPRPDEQPQIADRLARLRRDLGALAVFLVDMDGKADVRAGDVSGLDLDSVFEPLIEAFVSALKVSQLLGGLVPANVQFIDGDRYDIYVANVGQQFALVILFGGERGALQMGPVLRYGRQCAEDVLKTLKRLGVDVTLPGAAAPAFTPPAVPPPGRDAPLGRLSADAPAGRLPNDAPLPPASTRRARKTAPIPGAPAASPASTASAAGKQAARVTTAELRALEEASKAVTPEAAASFWENAGEGGDLEDGGADTITWEQAEKLGLIPPKG